MTTQNQLARANRQLVASWLKRDISLWPDHPPGGRTETTLSDYDVTCPCCSTTVRCSPAHDVTECTECGERVTQCRWCDQTILVDTHIGCDRILREHEEAR
jgi:hypothetical protein